LWRGDYGAGFRWGCATSAYQIEGATTADGRGASIWDTFCARPGTIRDGSSGAMACDHYHRWQEDIDLASTLGINAYRFSIAWPRIFPEGCGKQPNAQGLAFYSRLIDGLLARGIEPWPTLYHWDLPQGLQDRGGWGNRVTVDAFVDYADAATRILGDRVKRWITHNEPWCSAFLGHLEGVHAPGMRDLPAALQACHHILLSHGSAIPVIRNNVKDAQVGIALSLHPIYPASETAEDRQAMIRHDGLRNRWFLDPLHGRGYPDDIWHHLGDAAPVVSTGDMANISAATDFLGINYYFPETVTNAPDRSPIGTRVVERHGVERTAFGWEVSPKGMIDLLTRVANDYAPKRIYITENGSCYDDAVDTNGCINDTGRRSFLMRHLEALRTAIQSGIPVQGYFTWSLLDNFEWAEGYTRRFGLTYIDYVTQRRSLKLSGEWYRDFLHDSPNTHSHR